MANGRGASVTIKFRRDSEPHEAKAVLDPRDENMVGPNDAEEFEQWYWKYWFDVHVKAGKTPPSGT
jgi:hypothetical protein